MSLSNNYKMIIEALDKKASTGLNKLREDLNKLLPSHSASDAGKVLKISSSNGLEWAAAGGSGGDSSITDDQMVQLLIQADMLPVVYQVSGNQEQIFTDETGKVLLW